MSVTLSCGRCWLRSHPLPFSFIACVFITNTCLSVFRWGGSVCVYIFACLCVWVSACVSAGQNGSICSVKAYKHLRSLLRDCLDWRNGKINVLKEAGALYWQRDLRYQHKMCVCVCVCVCRCVFVWAEPKMTGSFFGRCFGDQRALLREPSATSLLLLLLLFPPPS